MQEYGADARGRSALLVAGPGNNGGDALVAARHLFHFGSVLHAKHAAPDENACIKRPDVSPSCRHRPVVVYPKRNDKQPLFRNLVAQLHNIDVPVLDALPDMCVHVRAREG